MWGNKYGIIYIDDENDAVFSEQTSVDFRCFPSSFEESGFEVTDKIVVNLQKDGFVEQAVASNLAYIKTETLTAELNLQDSVENGTEVAFDEVRTKLFIVKH